MKKTEIRLKMRIQAERRIKDMTDGQVKFQTLQENQRHNLQMEQLGKAELLVSKRKADVEERKQAQQERREEKFWDTELDYAKAQASTQWMAHVWNTIATIGGFAGNMGKAAAGVGGLFA